MGTSCVIFSSVNAIVSPSTEFMVATVKYMRNVCNADPTCAFLCDLMSSSCTTQMYIVAAAHCSNNNNQPPKAPQKAHLSQF